MLNLCQVTLSPTRLREIRGEVPAETVADAVGLTKQAISLYENGISNPSAKTLLRFMLALGITDIRRVCCVDGRPDIDWKDIPMGNPQPFAGRVLHDRNRV